MAETTQGRDGSGGRDKPPIKGGEKALSQGDGKSLGRDNINAHQIRLETTPPPRPEPAKPPKDE